MSHNGELTTEKIVNIGKPSDVPPGGRNQMKITGESDDKMQVSKEGMRTYKGSMTKKTSNKTFYG